MADHVYLKPLNTKSIIEILKKHKIDAVLPTMGGQTALNLCIEADEKGIWRTEPPPLYLRSIIKSEIPSDLKFANALLSSTLFSATN